MSVVISRREVINTGARYMAENRPDLMGSDPAKIADEMYKCNVAAYNQRYGESRSTEYGRYEEPKKRYGLVQVCEWLRSWRYQCMEGPVPMGMEVYKRVSEAIKEIEETYKEEFGVDIDQSIEWRRGEWW